VVASFWDADDSSGRRSRKQAPCIH
jgi:hypothetical protein